MPPATSGEEQELLQIKRHQKYYISGGDVYFLVENQLYRVHRYFFERESCVFQKQSQAPGTHRNGDSESVAIVPECSALAFDLLLGVFYNPKYSLFDWTIKEWTILLELTQKWAFQEVHKLAIRELEKQHIPLIARIVLYQRFDVDKRLLVPLYGVLCSRPEALNEEEAGAIGMKTTVIIFRARERLRSRPSDDGMSPLPADVENNDVHQTLATLLDEVPISPSDPTAKGKHPDRSGQGPASPKKNSNGRTGRPVGPSPKK